MFTKYRSKKGSLFLATLFAFCSLTSLALAIDSSDEEEILKKCKTKIKERPLVSNIVVLGPSSNGKSTLINMLIHTSEYSTRAKNGDALQDKDDLMKPIYHQDIFRPDVHKPVNPESFKGATLPEEFAGIPSIPVFMPILGPIPVRDFLGEQSEGYFDEEPAESAEKVGGGTVQPHVYKSHKKVSTPVFSTTFIDAPGIGETDRMAFFKKVLEKSPSDAINAFLLVVSAERLADPEFGPETFQYFQEISQILKQFDTTFTRVVLAVTHSANEAFLAKVPSHDDPRRIASVLFNKATDMIISTSNIFFFENQYNCLCEAAMDSLRACQTGKIVDPDIQKAFDHRQKNYQLNVLESFNLLKTVAKIKPAMSRSQMLGECGDREAKEKKDAKFQSVKDAYKARK